MAKPLLQFGHNYNYVSRAVMYSWMNKHLQLGLEEPVVEEDYKPLSIAEMSVWDEAIPSRRRAKLRTLAGAHDHGRFGKAASRPAADR